MGCEHQAAMLAKIQELEFVALDLNLYLDTHPCDCTVTFFRERNSGIFYQCIYNAESDVMAGP